MSEDNDSTLESFEYKIRELSRLRGKPIIVLYYPPFIPDGSGSIERQDVEYLYNILKNHEGALDKIDILIHTTGGDPYTAYRLIQLIHHYAEVETTIVPYYAFSAGTLMSMGSKEIAFAPTASISPLDIHQDNEETGEIIYLLSVDSYIEFARRCKELIEKDEHDTDVEEDLLVELVKEVGALNVGDIFRARSLSGYYADKLLGDYMFGDLPPKHKKEQKSTVVNQLIFGFPTHEFEIDYNLAKDLRLVVKKLPPNESELAESAIDTLNNLTESGEICSYVGEGLRVPFFQIIDGREATGER